MSPPVLHIYDPDHKIDPFMLLNLMSTRGGRVTLHVDRHDRQVDIVTIGSEGPEGGVMVASAGSCGCP
jgi:hypothetical protein